jgi:hypothetical protein
VPKTDEKAPNLRRGAEDLGSKQWTCRDCHEPIGLQQAYFQQTPDDPRFSAVIWHASCAEAKGLA